MRRSIRIILRIEYILHGALHELSKSVRSLSDTNSETTSYPKYCPQCSMSMGSLDLANCSNWSQLVSSNFEVSICRKGLKSWRMPVQRVVEGQNVFFEILFWKCTMTMWFIPGMVLINLLLTLYNPLSPFSIDFDVCKFPSMHLRRQKTPRNVKCGRHCHIFRAG